MDVIYTPPTDSIIYDPDLRSVKSADVKSMEAPTSVNSTADLFEDTEIFHPKINQPKTINVEHNEWIIQVQYGLLFGLSYCPSPDNYLLLVSSDGLLRKPLSTQLFAK